MAIDVGSAAILDGYSMGAGWTIISLNNPVNESGTVTSVEIYAQSNLADCVVGIFYLVSGNTYKCRDSESVGTVTGGSKQTFSVTLNAQVGDFIGIYYTSGTIYVNTSGGSGLVRAVGEFIDVDDQTAYSLDGPSYVMSLYGYSLSGDVESTILIGTSLLANLIASVWSSINASIQSQFTMNAGLMDIYPKAEGHIKSGFSMLASDLQISSQNLPDAIIKSGSAMAANILSTNYRYLGGVVNVVSGMSANNRIAIESHWHKILYDDDLTPGQGDFFHQADWIAGTTNQITVTDDGDDTVTLSLPQNIHTGASPTFAGLILNGTIATGLDMSGGTFATAVQNWPTTPVINVAGVRTIKFDDTNYNVLLGTSVFGSDEGQYNVGIGYQAGQNNKTTGSASYGDNNIFIGFRAGKGNAAGNTGYENIGVGTTCLYALTSGKRNVAFGYDSLSSLTSGESNFALGSNTFAALTDQYNNVGIGYSVGKFSTGSINTYIGANVASAASSSGNFNTFIGGSSGYNITSGSYNIFIGLNSGKYQTSLSNLLIIDNQARGGLGAPTDSTLALMYGVFAAAAADQSLRINGEILGSDGAKIGDGGTTNYTTISSTGDISFTGTAGIVLPHLMQSDSTDQTISSAVEEQVITFDTDVHHAGITRTSSSRFTIPKEGSYLITFSAIAICADAVPGKKINIWLKINGTNVANSNTLYTFKSQNMNTVITVTYIVHFAANDYFELWMYGNDTDIKLDATAAVADSEGVTPAIPACPSIIMTCNYSGKD